MRDEKNSTPKDKNKINSKFNKKLVSDNNIDKHNKISSKEKSKKSLKNKALIEKKC